MSLVAMWQAAGMALFAALFHKQLHASMPRVRHVGLYSALSAILLVVAHHAMEAARRSGEFSSLWDLALQKEVLCSSVGIANVVRVTALGLVATGFMGSTAKRTLIAMLGVLALPAAFLLTGHTSVHPQRWILAPLLAVHLLVVTFWFGALPVLLLATYRESAASVVALTASFTAVATWLVPLIALAGIVMALILLPDLNALRQPYGQLLLAKLGGFIALMALAVLNKWRLGPRIGTGGLSAMAAFRWSLVAEYFLIAGVLVVTATLTSLFSPES
jgi:putative copper export protein